MPRRARRGGGVQSPNNLPPQGRDVTFELARNLREPQKSLVEALLYLLDHDGFWGIQRKHQVVSMLFHARGTSITQAAIAVVMGVSTCLVSKYNHSLLVRPDDVFRPLGRPSPNREVFVLVRNFIENEVSDGRSVTMGVLMEYLKEDLHVNVSRPRLREYMKAHGFSYVLGKPTEDARVRVSRERIRAFYEHDLTDAVRGAHPSLVFNVDEMGAESFADRKAVKVFVPDARVPATGAIPVGVPRSTRRITLIGCVALDGERLMPAVITKSANVNSRLFETGYGINTLPVYHTKNSFITGEVFGMWLEDVLVPYVAEKRAKLRRQLGEFEEKAVLILDGCTAHTLEANKQILRRNGIVVTFLIAHTSHITQPLDLGVFGRVKSIIRDVARYSVKLNEVDEAIAADLDNSNGVRPHRRAEPGLALAEYILAILDAYEKAATRNNVASAFAQAGLLTMAPDPLHPEREVAYVDPTRARVAVRELGLFADREPVPRPPHRQIRIEQLRPIRRARVDLGP